MIPAPVAATAAATALSALSSLVDGATSSNSTTTPPAATERNDVLGQQDFLTLLVAQLQNQDPLNPLDSANFSAQLAQFSSLEQLVQINQRLADLPSSSGSTSTLDPVGLLGREVSAVSKSVTVKSGEASELEYTLDAPGEVGLEVHDGAGNLVTSVSLGEVGQGTHVLDLDAVSGVQNLSDGVYSVALTFKGSSAEPTTVETRLRGVVTGVDLNHDPPTLLIGDVGIALGDLREVRASDTSQKA